MTRYSAGLRRVPRSERNTSSRLDAACEELYRRAIALGSTLTGEHGIGAARRDFLVAQRGERAVEAMRAIKAALDPLTS